MPRRRAGASFLLQGDADPWQKEKRCHEEAAAWLREEAGHQWIQGTRPQTPAFGLTGSPAGLAGWIAEKFRAWTDNDGSVERAVGRDRMLANISLRWFTGCIGASFWPCYARMHGPWPIPDGRTVDVPMGCAAFPKEIRRPPRGIAAQGHTGIRRWTAMAKGGHFAAMEQPAPPAAEIAAFFRPLRERAG